MDGDLDSFFLLRDNETLAGDRELARDHDLIKRAHTYGITLADTRRLDEAYAAGKFEVEVTATVDREVGKLDEGALGWGQEKVLSTSTERVGSAAQRFVMKVSS